MDALQLFNCLLTVIGEDIVPKTRLAVAQGNKIFGAAALKKCDLSVIVAETSNKVENPLWHGEMHAIKKLYEINYRSRVPEPKDCIFLATHEPCYIYLSTITWGGYNNFYYLFSHEDSRDSFNIPHDIRILKEVFGNTAENHPLYNRKNAFWQSYNIAELVASLYSSSHDRELLLSGIDNLTKVYTQLSNIYQRNKGNAGIPLA